MSLINLMQMFLKLKLEMTARHQSDSEGVFAQASDFARVDHIGNGEESP